MKKITLFCAAVAAALGMNAQEITPLTAEMWHQWKGTTIGETTTWGVDATIIEGASTGCESFIGKEIGQGGMVIGPGSCNGDLFADLTEFGGLEGTATPGITLRFYFNRVNLQGDTDNDIKVDVDQDGKFSYSFSDLKGKPDFVHLNFVKTAAGWQGGKWPEGLETAVVESINLVPKNGDEPEVPVDPLAITGDWFHQWDGFDADANISNMYPYVDDMIGKEVGGGATILGTGVVAGDVYADLTEYAGIEAEGTPGVALRLLFNRPTQNDGITECSAQFDENGKFTFEFTQVKEGDTPASFIHLNAVKTPWAFPDGIKSCTVTKFNAIPKETSGVDAIGNADVNTVIYNIYGQRVDESYRGIVIKNGKKYINK